MPLNLQWATTHPCLCWRLLDTPRQVWVSPSWGHCSFLLGPGAHKVLFVPCQSLFPQTCVNSGSSMVGLMVTSLKRAYAIPQSASPSAPALVAGHCWPVPPQEMLKHSSVSVSVGSLVPGAHKVCLSPQCVQRDWGLILHMNSPLLPSCWGFSFALGYGVCSSTVQPPLQHLPSCWAFSDLDCGISTHSCSRAAQPLLQRHICKFKIVISSGWFHPFINI